MCHLQRLRKGKELLAPIADIGAFTTCTVDHCDRAYLCKGLCAMHYARERTGTDFYRHWTKPGIPPYLRPPPQYSGTSHRRIYALWGSAKQYPCVGIGCGHPAQEWAYDGTDPDELYSPTSGMLGAGWSKHSAWPEFYKPLCKKCHRSEDSGKLAAELHEYRLWKNATGLTVADL